MTKNLCQPSFPPSGIALFPSEFLKIEKSLVTSQREVKSWKCAHQVTHTLEAYMTPSGGKRSHKCYL